MFDLILHRVLRRLLIWQGVWCLECVCVLVCVCTCAHIHVHIEVNLQEVSQLSFTTFDSKFHHLHLHLHSQLHLLLHHYIHTHVRAHSHTHSHIGVNLKEVSPHWQQIPQFTHSFTLAFAFALVHAHPHTSFFPYLDGWTGVCVLVWKWM